MSMARHRSARRRDVHGVCATDARLGWAVCLTAWQDGLAMQARIGNRIRIVVAEAGDRHRPDAGLGQVRTTAIRLAVEGTSASKSVEVLSSRFDGTEGPSPVSLTIVDLYESGYADTARLNAPPVIHVASGGELRLTAVESTIAVKGGGDVLIAMSAAASRELSPDTWNALADRAGSFAEPCELRDDLVGQGGVRPHAPAAAPMAVLLRPRDR
jgi:hypothetical protein